MPKKGKYCFNDPIVRCKDYVNTDCINYTGSNLIHIQVSQNDTLTEILITLDDIISNIGSGGGTGDVTDGANLGTGEGIFAQKNGSILEFKSLIEGTGIGITSDSDEVTITNTAPDQTVTLTEGSNITITGTYPNFTITASGSSIGTDELVKVSSNDTTSGYLNGKLVQGTGILLTENNDGGNETFTVEHSDTSSVSNLDTSTAQVIDTLTFDTFGHVQTVTTRNLTLDDLGYVAPITLYTGDGTLLSDRTVNMDGKVLRFDDNGGFSNYFEQSIKANGYVEYNIQNLDDSLGVFESASPGTWSASSFGILGSQFFLAETTAGHLKGAFGNDRNQAGQWIDFLQEQYNDGTDAGSYWMEHREKWTGIGPFTSGKFRLDSDGASMRTHTLIGVHPTSYKGILVTPTSDVRFENYPNSRNDGTTAKALYIINSSGDIGYGNVNGGMTRTIVNTSGSITLGNTSLIEYVYFVTGSHTLSMPTAVGNKNRYTIKNNHSADITVDTAGAENIEGVASILLPPGGSIDVLSDQTNWWIV